MAGTRGSLSHTHTHKSPVYLDTGSFILCIGFFGVDIGLFCKRAQEKRLYSAKETYNFKEPINRSHLIWGPLSLV